MKYCKYCDAELPKGRYNTCNDFCFKQLLIAQNQELKNKFDFPEGVDFTGKQLEVERGEKVIPITTNNPLENLNLAMKALYNSIQLVRNLKFGKWELPCINIGGKADYTMYCLN